MSEEQADRHPNGILKDTTLKLIADTAVSLQAKIYYEAERRMPNDHQIADRLVLSDRARIQSVVRALYDLGWRPPP